MKGPRFVPPPPQQEHTPREKTSDEIEQEHWAEAKKDFDRASQFWFHTAFNWHAEFPRTKFHCPLDTQPQLHELLTLDMSKFYLKLLSDEKFGLFPLMAGCSLGQIGALNAESFCEQLISVANLIQTKGNTLMKDDLIKMLVILRMNKNFMGYMSTHYKQEILDHFDNEYKPSITVAEVAPRAAAAAGTDEEDEGNGGLVAQLTALDLPDSVFNF